MRGRRTGAAEQLEQRIRAGDHRVGILGPGYVGLPLCGAFCDAGARVVGFDIDPAKFELLRRLIDTRNVTGGRPRRPDNVFLA